MCLLLNKGFIQNRKVVAFSFLVFVAVAYCVESYINGVSFIRILLKSHMGWWYPVGILIMILGLVLEYGLHKKKSEKFDEYFGDSKV
jgi:magnesium-transporting ATPase (P-type)